MEMESSTDTPPQAVTNNYMPASQGLRLLNYFLDILILFVLFIILIIFSLLTQVVAKVDVYTSTKGIAAYLYLTLAWYAYLFCYYFVNEALFNRTFAKALTNTQVIDEQGGRPSKGKIAKRTLCRAIPFNEWSIFFNKHKTWHDSISKTLVVKTNTLPPEQQRKGKVMKVLAILLCTSAIGVWMILPVYESLTGGERIDISTNIPSDLNLVEYKKVSDESASYYSMVYEGESRKFIMVRMIAGFNFEPENPCIQMHPTKGGFGTDLVSEKLNCVEISREPRGIRVHKVSGFEDDIILRKTSPNYIISKPPFRYGIQFVNGSLSDDEVKLMATDLKTYTEDELRDLAELGRSKTQPSN